MVAEFRVAYRLLLSDVNDGAKNARFWCALRQNGAVISSKFRQ